MVDKRWGRNAPQNKRDYNDAGRQKDEQISMWERTAVGLPPRAFGTILSEDVIWAVFPAFPPSVRLAVLIGDTSKPGPYVVRVKVPAGVKLMPHMHPEDRIYTVISGVFYIGLGKTFDPARLEAYPPGSVIVLPGNTPHFHWAMSGEYVTQVSGTGPLGLDYVDPKDDPGKKKVQKRVRRRLERDS